MFIYEFSLDHGIEVVAVLFKAAKLGSDVLSFSSLSLNVILFFAFAARIVIARPFGILLRLLSPHALRFITSFTNCPPLSFFLLNQSTMAFGSLSSHPLFFTPS